MPSPFDSYDPARPQGGQPDRYKWFRGSLGDSWQVFDKLTGASRSVFDLEYPTEADARRELWLQLRPVVYGMAAIAFALFVFR